MNIASKRRLAVWTLVLAVFLGVSGCAGSASATPGHLNVVATTTLLASLAQSVGAGRANVTSLLPVGASPETYQPTPSDIARLREASVIVENGAGLEAWLAGTLKSVRSANVREVRCSDGLPIDGNNPHLWLNPAYARHYVSMIRDAFIAADPAGSAVYSRNAAAFDARIANLDGWIAAQIAMIPPSQRGMIVFHNAWLYYNKRYGLRTLGIVEENPGSEPSAAHLAALVDIARSSKTKALFAEPEYNPKLLEAIGRSAGITRYVLLYDDSVGAAKGTGDYISMLRYDTTAIVTALK